MKTYVRLLKLGVFTMNDVNEIYDNRNSAASALRSLLNNGLVKSIKRNLYVCNDIENKLPVVDKFKIGSSITKDAYISHYSALEFHGFGSQCESLRDSLDECVHESQSFPKIYVASRSKFKLFDYNGVTYQHVALKSEEGVVTYNKNRGTKVTNIERTVLDCMKDIDKAGGIERFLECLCSITSLNSEKLMQYLNMYNIQFLYQKSGYILEKFQYRFDLPQSFYDFCHDNIVKSTRYLTNNNEEDLIYVAGWHLFVSKELIFYMDHGCDLP